MTIPAVVGSKLAKEAGGYVGRHKRGVAAGIAITSLVTGSAGLGFVHSLRHEVGSSVTLDGGEGVVVSTYVMPPTECHGGYVTRVTGATATRGLTIHGADIPGAWARETYSGDIVTQVCNRSTAEKAVRKVDHDNHKISITIPADAMSTIVFEKDPTQSKSTPQDGFAFARFTNDLNTFNSLPLGLKIDTSNDLHSWLGGVARLSAYNTASHACSDKAWPMLQPLYNAEIQKDEANNANQFLFPGEKPYAPSDVSISTPTEMNVENQYGSRLTEISDQLKADGVTLDVVSLSRDANGSVCSVDLTKVTKP